MTTITAAQNGNWSNPNTWNGGVVPGNGDIADLNGFIVAMDISTIPASGTLLSLISPAKAGQLTVALNTLGNCAINATTITAGTNTTGLINVSGAAPTATLTITGNVTGGSASSAYGACNTSTGTITITGNVTGGSASRAAGAYNYSTGEIILNSCNLINGTAAVAYMGKPPTWNINANNYLKWSNINFPQQLNANQVLGGVVHGDIIGTLAGGGHLVNGGLVR